MWFWRTFRGWMLTRWLCQMGLVAQSRMDRHLVVDDSWTCRRSIDSTLVEIDFILSSARFQLQRSWCNFSLPIGLDHRCVHCVVAVQVANTKQPNHPKHLKGWHPTKDSNNRPSSYHTCLNQRVSNMATLDWEGLEALLNYAGLLHAAPKIAEFHFFPSSCLKFEMRTSGT